MKNLTVELISNGPLLIKSDRLANPMAEITKAHKKLTGDTRLKATEEGQLMIAKSEYLASFYDDEDGIRLPGINIWKSLVMGARKYKKGQTIEGGVIVLDPMVEFEYDGPRNHIKLWENKKFVDGRTVVIARKRVMCHRPLLTEWKIKVNIVYDPSIIDQENLMMYWTMAGMMCRIGDYRTLFGRYTVELIK